jgi:hypothetical protein
MVVYEVTMDMEPAIAGRVERYMREKHIPEILATGCFASIELERGSDTRLRTRYAARTRSDVDRYLRDHSPRFRADTAAHFPTGLTASREVWSTVEHWE